MHLVCCADGEQWLSHCSPTAPQSVTQHLTCGSLRSACHLLCDSLNTCADLCLDEADDQAIPKCISQIYRCVK